MCTHTVFGFCTQITLFGAMYKVVGHADRDRPYRVIKLCTVLISERYSALMIKGKENVIITHYYR